MHAEFIHLKVHSEYSVSDGIIRIAPFIDRTAELGMPAVALTDLSNLFALVKFYRKAMGRGVKPIVGAEVVLCEDDELFRVTLLCQNKEGYHHLTELLSSGFTQGQQQDGTPTITWSQLEAHQAGLIVLSGARRGDVGQAIIAGNNAQAEQRLKRWINLLGDRYYLELQRTLRENEDVCTRTAIRLAQQHDVAVVATNEVVFLERSDFEAHEARVCIHSGYVLNDSKRPRNYSEEQYLKSPAEMCELFSDIPEAIANTVEIAKRCNLELSVGEVFLPQFPVPGEQTIEEYFTHEAKQALKQRLHQLQINDPERVAKYDQRLQLELDVINSMGFPGYYLIVADFIAWAKQHNIPVGPGRGSGAGSLVAYVLGITELDPLTHELLFERFLNPERVSMPDFDIDFCMEQRDRVIDYVAEHYGRDAVSQIITFGTMAAKAVVRDVGRVLGHPYGFVDKLAKLIPFELGITLDKALAQEERLAERYRNEEEVTILIDLARKLEGVVRNAGKHAGGVVIAPTKLTDFVPLYVEPGGSHLVTQFDKDDVEAIGLVKFDFLGLRTLTIIDWTLQTINKQREQQSLDPIDIQFIPLDDEKTYDLLCRCATTAVFQLESRGMKDLVRRLQPDCFEEITALVALFRPGPLQSGMVDDFIDRKHGRAPVRYPHPDLEPILQPTYGVILYQEQVMQIAQVLAGYSLGGADILRRAMGKKKPEEMAKQREVFVSGAAARGIGERLAGRIFDLMEKFAGYGFNKSHSAAYALIAYQTAWLKAHYPAEFMAAVLSSDMDNTDKVVGFLEECRHMRLTVRPPNINEGQYQFTVNDAGEIVYGLGAVKGVGEAAVENIVEERRENGEYDNLFRFSQRVDTFKVNRRVLEPLILSGAMDCFQQNRATLLSSVDKALQASDQAQRNAQAGQNDLFGTTTEVLTPEYAVQEAWGQQTLLQGEKDTLGWYLSGHPIQAYEAELQQLTTATIAELHHLPRKNVTVAGLLLNIRVIITRTGKRMGIIQLEDRTGRVEATLFSDVFEKAINDLEKDRVFIVKGKLEDDEYSGGVRIRAESAYPIDHARATTAKRLLINVQRQQQADELLNQLPELFTPFRGGRVPVAIAYHTGTAGAELMLGDAWRITPSEELLNKLRQLCGEQEVVLEY